MPRFQKYFEKLQNLYKLFKVEVKVFFSFTLARGSSCTRSLEVCRVIYREMRRKTKYTLGETNLNICSMGKSMEKINLILPVK